MPRLLAFDLSVSGEATSLVTFEGKAGKETSGPCEGLDVAECLGVSASRCEQAFILFLALLFLWL